MKVNREIIENVFLDWRKKDIPKHLRAKLIKEYRETYGISQRDLEKITGISKSTLHDWENPERNSRYSNEEVKLKNFLDILKKIDNPDTSLLKTIKKIDIELNRLKDIIQRKSLNIG